MGKRERDREVEWVVGSDGGSGRWIEPGGRFESDKLSVTERGR